MKRNYGIDLLKMVAMILVVSWHILGRGGVYGACSQNPHSLLYGIQSLFYMTCACCVDCFVLATGFIMCKHNFKYNRIIKIWGQVVFYSFCMTLVAKLFFQNLTIGWKDWMMAVMPLSFDRYWFVSRYVGLFFLIPILNHLLVTLDRKAQGRLILTGFILLSVFPSISGNDMFVHHWGYSLIWFIYLYLLAGYISLNRILEKFKIWTCVLVFGLMPICALGFSIVGGRIYKAVGCFNGEWGAYSSPFILAEAVALLMFFAKVKIKYEWLQTLIGYIGPSIFSVYALHSNSVFRRMIEWNGRFAPLAEGNAFLVPLKVLAIALLIFSICIIIDVVRRNCLRIIERRCHSAN